MGVKCADRAVEFAEDRSCASIELQLPPQPMGEYGDLLTQGSGTRPLDHASAPASGHISVGARQLHQGLPTRDRACGPPNIADGIANHHGISQIIDVV